ncbi:M42 family peptidase [Clostridium senegalense]|uniref:M42 family peptidase n=1 Tax=Clostridium senegalense TaxID=1465809 RepID=A0A6M0H369_9CLOT|nr:M42 family peptidase [Clostridium senegalense]NEU04533.1 M42 family peptidase [Clostridium senegalense]
MDILLNKLAKAFGTSGHEKNIRLAIIEELEKLPVKYEVDKMDNVIVTIGKKNSDKDMMIVSHMDSVGLIVNFIDEKGHLSVDQIGNFEVKDFVNNLVVFENGTVGRVCCKKDEIKIEDIYIDLFVDEKEEALKKVKEGDVAVLYGNITEIEDNIIGYNLNNKIGCYSMIKALQYICKHNLELNSLEKKVHFVFSTQKQLGGRGARAAAFKLEPNYCLAIDSENTSDNFKIGQGIGIHVVDKNLIVHHEMKELLENVCKDDEIKSQYVFSKVGTDGGMIHKELCGIKTGAISLPVNYKNTLNEIISVNDIELLTKVIIKTITIHN